MKILISTIGSRGDVQPLLALAQQFSMLGQSATLCAPPNFRDWVESSLGIRYVYVAYCPATLPSPEHPPTKMDVHYPSWLPAPINRALWTRDARGWNRLFGPALNDERTKLGLPPVPNVQRYVFGDRPWLAADPVLAPAPDAPGMHIVQAGSWVLGDETPLPTDVQLFLESGDPPVYVGFGSMREEKHTGAMLIDAARRIGRRSVILQGWADLGSSTLGDDCLVVGDVDHDALFPRMAAIVHHGGAGTTHAAARSGRPQIAIPHHYDQFYWAGRVKALNVGTADFTRGRLTARALARSLERCLSPERIARADELSRRMTANGARVAAERLIAGIE